MSNLPSLIKKVEAASGPDYTLDAQIGKAVGAEHFTTALEPCVPCYTSSLDAAMSLVPPDWRCGFEQNASCDEPGKCYAWVWPFESNYDPDWQMGQEGQQSNPDAQKGYAATPALALCAAALRSLANEGG